MADRGRRLLWAGARSAGRLLGRRLGRTPAAATWAQIGEDWFQTLGQMKGAAMKLGQLVSQYADVLPPELVAPLARLQRASQPRPFAEIEQVLGEEWSAAHWAAVDAIEPSAMAAASIGQVHAARLADGREVVIKVRYPGVAEAVDEDVDTLGRLLRMARLLPIDGIALDGLLAEIRARLREETDYGCELRNLCDMRRAAAHPGVRYPEPVELLCTPAVLVTTACPADDLAGAAAYPQAVRDRIGEILLRWFLQQVMVAGVVHADPHPGNFGFSPDGTLTVYDFGCVKHLPRHLQPLLRDGMRAGREHDWSGLHQMLYRIGALEAAAADPVRRAQLREQLRPYYQAMTGAVIDPLRAQSMFDFSEPALIEDARAVLRADLSTLRHFRPVPELAFVGRAASGLYWMLRALKARVPVAACLDEAIGG